MWATDGAYLKVVGWGYYYLVTVPDDYSRFILAWRLQPDMTAGSLIEVVQEAVGARLPLPCLRPLPLTPGDPPHRGLTLPPPDQREVGTLPLHPQGAGEAGAARDSVSPEKAVAAFVDYYNHRRYHEGIGNVTPADVYYGRRDEILERKKEVSKRTLQQRGTTTGPAGSERPTEVSIRKWPEKSDSCWRRTGTHNV